MPVEDRELAAGTRLVARYKKQDRTCEVVTTDDGVRYRLDDRCPMPRFAAAPVVR